MNTRATALCACALFLSACGGVDDIEMVDGEDIGHDDQALEQCPTHPPELDAPLDTAWLTFSAGGGAQHLERTSPDARYSESDDRHYVTQINGITQGALGALEIFASNALPATTEGSCAVSRLDATLHCFTTGNSCWAACAKQSVSGTWHPYADGSGGICEAVARFTRVDLAAGTKSVRVQAAAYNWAVAVPVTEGASLDN